MKQVIKRRRNFLPTLVLAILFWAGWGYIVYMIPPSTNISILAFFISFFLAIFLTSALIFANSRRGLMFALLLILSLLFCFFRIANILNLILLAGIFLTLEFYYSR